MQGFQGGLPARLNHAHTCILLALLSAPDSRQGLGKTAEAASCSGATCNVAARPAGREGVKTRPKRSRARQSSTSVNNVIREDAQKSLLRALQPRGTTGPIGQAATPAPSSEAGASSTPSLPLLQLASNAWTHQRPALCSTAPSATFTGGASSGRRSSRASKLSAGASDTHGPCSASSSQGSALLSPSLNSTSHAGASVLRKPPAVNAPLLSAFDAGRFQKAVTRLQQRQAEHTQRSRAAILRDDLRASRRHQGGSGLAGTYGGGRLAGTASDSAQLQSLSRGGAPQESYPPDVLVASVPQLEVAPVWPAAGSAADAKGGAISGSSPPGGLSQDAQSASKSYSAVNGLNALRSMQPLLVADTITARAARSNGQPPHTLPNATRLLPSDGSGPGAGTGQSKSAAAAQQGWEELLADSPAGAAASRRQHANTTLPRHFNKLPGYLKGSARERGRLDSFQTAGLTATEILERIEAAAQAQNQDQRLPVLRRSHPARDATRKSDFLRRGSGAVHTSIDSQVGFLAESTGRG